MTAVSALIVDTYVDADVRQEAFAVARLLRGERYGRLLAEVADQAELEGTPLLAAVEAGKIPITVAVQIAASPNGDVQIALQEAYGEHDDLLCLSRHEAVQPRAQARRGSSRGS